MLFACITACGDDSDDTSPTRPATTSQTTETTPSTTGATETSATTTSDTTTPSTTGVTCPNGSLLVLSPSSNVSPLEDTNLEEDGVQIDVRLATNLPEGSIVTLEHATLPVSIGARIEGTEVTISDVPLTPGENTFNAIADAPDCSLSIVFSLTLDPGTSCSLDADCPNGESCAPQGVCAPCSSTCTEDEECGPGGTCLRECTCQLPYSYVLLEDRSGLVNGATPGADVDSISLTKADEQERFATRVLDFELGGASNEWNDITQLLGPPDSGCEITNFTSFGGGWAIVSFGTSEDEIFIEPGDSLRVYELGPTFCPERTDYRDEPYALSISVATEEDTFVEIGSGGQGTNTILVPDAN